MTVFLRAQFALVLLFFLICIATSTWAETMDSDLVTEAGKGRLAQVKELLDTQNIESGSAYNLIHG